MTWRIHYLMQYFLVPPPQPPLGSWYGEKTRRVWCHAFFREVACPNTDLVLSMKVPLFVLLLGGTISIYWHSQRLVGENDNAPHWVRSSSGAINPSRMGYLMSYRIKYLQTNQAADIVTTDILETNGWIMWSVMSVILYVHIVLSMKVPSFVMSLVQGGTVSVY